jgi:hypothetical protein
MYVYVWKDPHGVPFYVGVGATPGRFNPKSKGHRNKDCLAKLNELGADAVVIELHTVETSEVAKKMECDLIALYGRLKDGSGTLTNRSKGGEFPEVTEETKTLLREHWQDPLHREKTVSARVGLKRDLPESTKSVLREKLAANPAMKGWSERNGKDPDFDAKRIAGIQAAQPKRAEKMRDPVALAQRKERLKATLNSPEYLAKRALWDTPELRAQQSAQRKAWWAAKKAAG